MGRPIAMLLLLLPLSHGVGATTSQPALLPCRCDVVGRALDSCSSTECLCSSINGTVNASDFHARECRGGAGTVAVAVGSSVAAVLVLLVVLVLVWRCRRTAGAAGWGKQEPPAAHGQPRYVSREAESRPAAPGGCVAPDYENVFIGSSAAPGAATAQDGAYGWQQEGGSLQALPDHPYFLESDAVDQPIYANTGTPGEDIYVTPDP